MSILTLQAPAKVNLTLDILGARPDGYHEMEMVMQSVSLCDTIRLNMGFPGGVRAESGLRFLPNDKGNLAVAAALAFRKATGQTWNDLLISIEKHIPVCAGTAGGSSDAAAVLRGLNQLTGSPLTLPQLAKVGEEVGSDVPYCVMGGTALAQGRGEKLTPLTTLPPCYLVLCKPRFSISTPALFREWDKKKRRLRPDTKGMLEALRTGDLTGVARRMFNVFEDVLSLHQRREIDAIKNALLSEGALGAAMSGSGPTVVGLFQQKALAKKAADLLRTQQPEVFLTEPV
ncbi:MAG: 4-(cytidine 5'-diphospho)-2-C-methyl-D-erythritol kinase [Evtepia sp.]|uniref:4-(cytidine 5'-diphospho)-2-C-methyl-D-erythritol kinase n=1 Tax=Evtepia sp. TaxID=2773933 RepID=UPI002A75FC7F|nr:4-(cytidine 5'-diphospho)-2-C-methyl-D-erythritol kinase [Evtepia sp.]MDY3014475.1 4-(cytidine 5'-diphospho)-2-C-methyl-D-erythritol kinase [Evtepia sp.]